MTNSSKVSSKTFRKSDGISFERWEKFLSAWIERKTGLPLECGEDVDSRNWYDDDLTVESAIQNVLDCWDFPDYSDFTDF